VDFPMPLWIFSGIVYFIRNWQYLHFVIATACASGLPIMIFIIPESPRWLVLHKRKNEAVQIFLKVKKTLVQLCILKCVSKTCTLILKQ